VNRLRIRLGDRSAGERRTRALSVRAFWQRLSLWPRLVIAVTVGFGVLFVVFSVLAVRAVDSSTRRIVNERAVIAEMAAGEIDGVLDRSRRVLAAAAADRSFEASGASIVDADHALAHAYASQGPVALAMYVIDPSGQLRLAQPSRRLVGAQTVVPRVFVTHALVTRGPALSAPFRDRSGNPAVALAYPALGAGGQLRFLLVEVLDVASPDFTKPLAEATRLGRTGHGELVGPAGIVIASTETGDALEPGEHRPFYRRMLRSRNAGVDTVSYTPPEGPPPKHAPRHVMAWAPVPGAPWGVAVGGTVSDTFGAVQRLRRTLLVAGAGALAALWLAALVGARFLVRPVRALTSAARDMASGDLERPIAVGEGGEIGLLAQSLESMRAQLRESLETATRWGRELEAKVEERTAELRLSNRQLAAVSAVATAGSRAYDLPSMLDACLAAILEHTHMDGASVRLVEPRERRLGPALSRGVFADMGGDEAPVDMECPCREVLERETAVYPAPGRCCASCGGGSETTLALLPLKTRKELNGVLAVARNSEAPFSREERRMLAAIGDQLALAIENARLLEELARIDAQREVQRLRTELISAVSHELRTPLGFIKGYATTLLRGDDIDPETRTQFLEIIDEETTKLERMVEELLDTSRLQAGRLEISPLTVELAALVEGIVAKARPSLAAAGHEAVLRSSDGPVNVVADPLRVEQVLENLLENSARYSPAPAPIEIRVGRDDGYGVVAVRDHGDGVSEDELERIFEPFYRGAAGRSSGERGVGLGLAICRGLIEAQGGAIWIETQPGAGATFAFSLPAAAEAPASPVELSPSEVEQAR